MTNPAIVDCYLRELLAERFGDDIDVQDNAYTLPLETQPRVQVVPVTGPGLRVLVDAVVAEGVATGPAVLVALNDLNAQLPYGRVFLVDGQVVVEHTVLGDELTPALLDHAIRFVDWVVGFHGPDLAADLGGRTVTEPQPRLPLAPDAPPADLHDAVRPVAEDAPPAPAITREPVGVNAAGYL